MKTNLPAAAAEQTPGTLILRILRVGVAGCFIGHGAFGIITKAAWLPYFAVGGVSAPWAWRLMRCIGTMDIAIGLLALLWPCRALFLWATVWGLWAALLPRFPASRAGSFGSARATMACRWPSSPWWAGGAHFSPAAPGTA